MRNIKCRYCQHEVDTSYINKLCPNCQKTIESDSDFQMRIRAFERHYMKSGLYSSIQEYVWNDDINKAGQLIVDGVDGDVHSAIVNGLIDRIQKGRPKEWVVTRPSEESFNKTIASLGPLTHCSACSSMISKRAETCPHCGNPTGVHVCPKCNGVNTRVITGTSKAASIFLWGAFAANKVVSKYECKDCGHKF